MNQSPQKGEDKGDMRMYMHTFVHAPVIWQIGAHCVMAVGKLVSMAVSALKVAYLCTCIPVGLCMLV